MNSLLHFLRYIKKKLTIEFISALFNGKISPSDAQNTFLSGKPVDYPEQTQ